jgi:hypothetical protein
MSVRFVPATIRHELESQNTQLDAQRENFQSVADAIDRYRGEGALSGRAFQAHKDYFGEGHLPFIRALRSMMLSQRNANVYHISRLGGLTHAYYNQAQIESELSQLAWSIPAAQAMVILLWPHHAAWQTILDTRRARRALLQEKQQQLATYLGATASIYNDAEAQLHNVRRLLTRIEMQRMCDTTGVVSLPTQREVDNLIAAQDMMESWINTDGTLDYIAVGILMSKGIDNLTQVELDALTMLFGNPSVCIYDLARAYQKAYTVTPVENFWRLQDVLTTIVGRLADKFMLQANDWLWLGLDADPNLRPEIDAQMQRIQILAFISGLESNGRLSQLADFLELDYRENTIRFFNVTGTLSTFRGLFRGTYVYDALEAIIERDFEAAVRRNPDLAGHLLSVLKFIPGINKTAAGVSTAKSIAKAVQDAISLLSQDATLSAAERDLLQRMTALAIARIGGGVLSVHMSTGSYMLLGTTTMTNNAMIRLAGLEAIGFEPGEALAALGEQSNWPEEYERILEFLYDGEAGAFQNMLLGIFQDNFNTISTQFPDSNLVYSTIPSYLPLPVLEEVLNIWRAQSG